MAKPKVLSTHELFPDARKILDAACDVDYWTEAERPSRDEFLRRVKDKEGLVCLLTEKVNEEMLRVAAKLRIVANVAVGFDNIDVDACTKRGVVATNTPGVLDETTADFAWTLLMAVARRLGEGEQLARSGNWKGWNLDQLCGADVWGKTLGIVGFRANRAGGGAARERLSDEGAVHGCGASFGRGGKIRERGISRHERIAGGIGFHQRACAAVAGDPWAV